MLFHGALWLSLPSRNYNADGLNEIQVVEAPAVAFSAKHPAAESSMWLMMRTLRVLGYEGRALRPVQVASGVWMTLFLALTALLAVRLGHGGWMGLATAALAGGFYSSLSLSLDPYLFYWPPALALLAGAFVVVARPLRRPGAMECATGYSRAMPAWGRWSATVALLTGAGLYNPMVLMAVPLAAWEWWAGREPLESHVSCDREKPSSPLGLLVRRIAPALRPLLMVSIPFALYFATQHLPGIHRDIRGIYGQFGALTLRHGWYGLTGALFAREWGQQMFGVLHGLHSVAALATTAAVLLLPLVFVAGSWVFMVHRQGRLHPARHAIGTALSLGTAFGAGLFVLWWDPIQYRFWILPLWLGMVAGLRLTAPPDSVANRLAYRVALALLAFEAALFWTANVAGYALPAATRPNPELAQAMAVDERFGPDDWLMYPVFANLYIDTFSRARSWGMMELSIHRPDGLTTMQYLERYIGERHAEGGRVFFLLPATGEPWVPEFVRVQPGIDYTDADFARIRWGETVKAGVATYREALAVE